MQREEREDAARPGSPRSGGAEDRAPEATDRKDDDALRADREHHRELQRARSRRVIKAAVAVGLAVLLIIFIVANSHPVEVNFVFAEREPRLIWVMFVCAVIGGLIGYLIGRPSKADRLHRGED